MILNFEEINPTLTIAAAFCQQKRHEGLPISNSKQNITVVNQVKKPNIFKLP